MLRPSFQSAILHILADKHAMDMPYTVTEVEFDSGERRRTTGAMCAYPVLASQYIDHISAEGTDTLFAVHIAATHQHLSNRSGHVWVWYDKDGAVVKVVGTR